MDVATYSRAQDAAWRPLRRLIRALLHTLGVPVTEPQVQDFAIRLYRPTVQARDLNFTITRNYLASVAPEVLIPRPRDYPFRALTSTLERAITPLRIVGEPVTEDNRADILAIEAARKAVEGPVSRQVQEPAREVVAQIGETNERYGWARVLVGATSCSFCAAMASRGPVYTSKQAALGRGGASLGLYHTAYPNKNGKMVGGDCDCRAVLVPKGSTTWEGHDAHQKLSKLWKDTTEGVHYTDSLNVFRREWDQLVGDGKTHQYLPESVKPEPEPTPKKPAPITVKDRPEPLPGLLRKTETLDPAADLALVNPRWRESKQWQVNCTRCATTIELRARGYDVTAGPYPPKATDNNASGILARWLSPDGQTAAGLNAGRESTVDRVRQLDATKRKLRDAADFPIGMAEVDGSRVFDWLPEGSGDNGAKLTADAAVEGWGEGARGYITVRWKGRGGGHIFNVENRDGKAVYLDGQSNEIDASKHWDRISSYGYPQTARIVRIDDLTPRSSGPNTTGVEEWVIPRDEKYFKSEATRQKRAETKAAHARANPTPKNTDLVKGAEEAGISVRSSYSRYKAFTDGAKDAKTKPTVDATRYNSNPDIQDAYLAGFFWYRRWRETQ